MEENALLVVRNTAIYITVAQKLNVCTGDACNICGGPIGRLVKEIRVAHEYIKPFR